jgi:hypothetical protein
MADATGLRPVFAIVAAFLAVGIASAFTLHDPEQGAGWRTSHDPHGVLAAAEADR